MMIWGLFYKAVLDSVAGEEVVTSCDNGRGYRSLNCPHSPSQGREIKEKLTPVMVWKPLPPPLLLITAMSVSGSSFVVLTDAVITNCHLRLENDYACHRRILFRTKDFTLTRSKSDLNFIKEGDNLPHKTFV